MITLYALQLATELLDLHEHQLSGTKRPWQFPPTGLENARKDEVKFQLEPRVSAGWRGILGPNFGTGRFLAAETRGSFPTVKSLRRFAKPTTNRSFSWFLPPIIAFAGWMLRDVEMGYNHDSNGRSTPPRSWNRLYTRLMAENGNWLAEVKPW